jgi:hypothetical protein
VHFDGKEKICRSTLLTLKVSKGSLAGAHWEPSPRELPELMRSAEISAAGHARSAGIGRGQKRPRIGSGLQDRSPGACAGGTWERARRRRELDRYVCAAARVVTSDGRAAVGSGDGVDDRQPES